MITLTRTGLLLTLSADTIPAQGSSDVPISFVNDPETYTGYTIQPLAGWYKNGCKKSAVCRYADGMITVPAAAFKQNGEIMLAIALIDPSDANHIEVTQPASAYVIPAPNDPTELPDEDTWQAAVDAFVEQVMQPYQTNIQSAIDTANAASQAANEAASTANDASQAATNTSNAINEAIENGDFIPQITATATQGAEGTQPSVTVTGDKATPSINFTIPKGDTGAQGPQGEKGIQGPKGDTGAQGPAGPSTITDATGATIATAPLTAPQNLLVNGDFKINQRGQTEYTSTDFQPSRAIDCWRIGGQAILHVDTDRITLEATGSSEAYLAAHIDKDLTGKKLSVAVKVRGDKVYTGTVTVSTNETVFISDGQYMTVSAKYDSNRKGTQLYINVKGGHSYPFEYVDAFEGEIVYPHVEEDNATALMRCLPYYRRVYMGYTAYALSNTFSMISAQSIAPMLNDSPTITTNVGNRTNVGVANYTYDASGALILTATASAAGAIRIYNEIVELSCEVQ